MSKCCPISLTVKFMKDCMNKYPPLSYESEREMIEDGKHDEGEIRELLFLHNMRLALLLSNKYWSRTYDKDDGVQRALIGLWKAAQQFDFARGWKFTSYCVPKIIREVTYERNLNDWKMDSITVSLDKKIGRVDDGEFTLADVLDKIKRPDAEDLPPIDKQMRSLVEGADIAQLIFKNVDALSEQYVTDKQKAMFKAFFAADNYTKSLSVFREVTSYTYDNIGEMFDCTRQNVRIAIARVMRFLRMRLSSLGILHELEDSLHYKLQFDEEENKTPPPRKLVRYEEYHADADDSSVRACGGEEELIEHEADEADIEEDKHEAHLSAPKVAYMKDRLKGVKLCSFGGNITTNWNKLSGVRRRSPRTISEHSNCETHFRPMRGCFYSEETMLMYSSSRRQRESVAIRKRTAAENVRLALMRRNENFGLSSQIPTQSDHNEEVSMRQSMLEAVESRCNCDIEPTIPDAQIAAIDIRLVSCGGDSDDGSNDYECEE